MPTILSDVQRDEATQPYAADVLAGSGESLSLLRLQVQRIAPHFRTALVSGERGVGKDTVARELHRLSGKPATRGPFTLLDVSDFAQSSDPVELSGVLYLKGLDRLDPALQEKLVARLRLIQRETRILISSECDLRGMLATGRLRQNLAGRVGGLEIRVGALRDRNEDFDAIVASMLLRTRFSGWFGEEALRALRGHSWPGNLAELWSVVGQVASVRGEIAASHLPALIPRQAVNDAGARLDKVMQRHVFEVLQRCSGNKLKAAEILGISRSTLYRMLDAAAAGASEEKAVIEQTALEVLPGLSRERRAGDRPAYDLPPETT